MIGQRATTFLAGIGTDPQALEALDQAAAQGQDHTIELLHYKRNGSAFCDQVRSTTMRWHVIAFCLISGSVQSCSTSHELLYPRGLGVQAGLQHVLSCLVMLNQA